MRSERRSGVSSLGRNGFTLVEIAVVVSILGLITAVVMPKLDVALARADGANVVMDMRHVRQAAVEHVELSGNLPATYDWGERPVELSGTADTTRYGYKDVEYRLWTDEGTGRAEFRVRYSEESPIGLALLQYRRPGTEDGSVNWTPTETTFRLFTVSVGTTGNGNGNSGGNGNGNSGGNGNGNSGGNGNGGGNGGGNGNGNGGGNGNGNGGGGGG